MIGGYVATSSAAHYTVPEVVQEARGLAAAASIAISLDAGRLKVWDASSGSTEKVRKRLAGIGGELSETDVKLIALAVDLQEGGLDPIILTDDYGLQNLSRVLGIEHRSVATRGIKSVFEWKWTCPGCEREFNGKSDSCPVCGTKLRKVIARKSG